MASIEDYNLLRIIQEYGAQPEEALNVIDELNALIRQWRETNLQEDGDEDEGDEFTWFLWHRKECHDLPVRIKSPFGKFKPSEDALNVTRELKQLNRKWRYHKFWAPKYERCCGSKTHFDHWLWMNPDSEHELPLYHFVETPIGPDVHDLLAC